MEEAPKNKDLAGKIQKWLAICAAIVSLILGIRQVVVMVKDSSKSSQVKKGEELKSIARQFADAGNYGSAWQTIGQAVELDPAARGTQVDIAMEWLRNARLTSVRGESTFTDISLKLLPVLYRAVDTTKKERAATLLAHIGWANFLMYKEGDRGVKVEDSFQRALMLDPGNAYANVMEGFWLLYPGHGAGSLDKAERYFSAALKEGQDDAYVHNLMRAAYSNNYGDEYDARLIRLADNMRRANESMDSGDRMRILTRVYYSPSEGKLAAIAKLVSTRDQLETFLYLTQGIDLSEKPYLKTEIERLRGTSAGFVNVR